jgi:hypothetical protein
MEKTPQRINMSKKMAALCMAPERKPAGSRHGLDEDEWNDPPIIGRALVFEALVPIPHAPVKAPQTNPFGVLKTGCKRPNSYSFDRYPSAFQRCVAALKDATEE